MIEILQGRELVSPHAIGKKLNEIIEVFNQVEMNTPEENNNQESPSESETPTENIKKEKDLKE